MVSSLEVLALLDSVAASYPSGIPRTATVEEAGFDKALEVRVRCAGPLSAPLVFVGFAGADSLVAGPTGALLEAAVVKGMKLDPANIAFVSLSAGATTEELLGVLHQLSAPVGVALGASVGHLLGLGASSGSWAELAGRAWRVTPELRDVLADPMLKRPLWNDLQAVGQRLSEIKGEER